MSRVLPSAVKQLRGTAQPCRTNDFEPSFPAGNLPEPPEWILGPALVEWNRLVEPLQKSGVVTDMDFTTFAIYCKMWGDFCESARVDSYREPFTAAMFGAMKGYAVELGLTPAARSKVVANNAKAKGNKFNGF